MTVDTPTMDGKLAYLKPQSSKWEPLSADAWTAFNPDSEVDFTTTSDEQIQKNIQHFQDFLSKSLQLPNLSFFAGSGTSLGKVGGPSMWMLWEKAVKDDARASSVRKKVKYDEADNPNIEHFLSHCDAYLAFNEDDEVESFLLDVKKIILSECSEFLKGDSDISAYEILLQRLARRRVRDPRLKVFTTNYDMNRHQFARHLLVRENDSNRGVYEQQTISRRI